jgi:N-glycosyltransferase
MVYVSLGSLLTRTPGLATYTAAILQRIARGLAELPVTVVMSTGPTEHERLCAELRDLPNLLLLKHAPQTLVMRTADLFVTHAGFGSLREAISNAVPMLAVGLTTDQPGNAHRLSHLGLGVSLPPYAEQVEFTAAAELILTDPARRATVRTWQRRMLAQDPLTQVLPTALAEATQAPGA